MSRSLPAVEAYWLGRRPYRAVWALQRALVAQVLAGERPSCLLLLEHPHVFTMGRRAVADHLLWDAAERERRGVEVVWSDRGGDVTYHGPGQLVGYPVLDLPALGSDIMLFLRALERSLIAQLAELGIATAAGEKGKTGVWADSGKIAAIGVHLNQRRVTNHGFALNLSTDLGYFAGIVPCGLDDTRVASVESVRGSAPASAEVARSYCRHFEAAFGAEVAWRDAAGLAGLEAAAPPEPQAAPLLGLPG